MLGALKGLLASRKFWMAILGSAVVTVAVKVLPLVGLSPEMTSSVVQYIAAFFGVGLAGFGLADFGKERKG